jgi:sulfur-oxidizing protein SoxY
MGGAAAVESKDISITSPDIAENGAVVPFTIASKLPKTESVALLVEKNPSILGATFNIPDGTSRGSTPA